MNMILGKSPVVIYENADLDSTVEVRGFNHHPYHMTKGALKCSFFAVAALVGAGLLSCCLLRQPASFTAQPTNEQFQDPFRQYENYCCFSSWIVANSFPGIFLIRIYIYPTHYHDLAMDAIVFSKQ